MPPLLHQFLVSPVESNCILLVSRRKPQEATPLSQSKSWIWSRRHNQEEYAFNLRQHQTACDEMKSEAREEWKKFWADKEKYMSEKIEEVKILSY